MTATNRPFRFGGGLFAAPSAAAWADGARRLEDLGYDTVWTGDHLAGSILPPFPALLAAAMATTRVRVATAVIDNDFRHPAALAKEAATVDRLTNGRLDLGIGAGWLRADYDNVGLSFDPPGTRVSRLEEAVQVLKGLWHDAPFSFEGQHYTIRDFNCEPKPLQQPHPPLLIGGGGRRLLSLAGREADIVALAWRALPEGGLDRADMTMARFERKIDWVRDAAGDRFDQIELALHLPGVVVADDRRVAAEEMIANRGLPMTVDEVLESPFSLIGTVDQMAERLLELRERFGITYFFVFPPDTETFAQVIARLPRRTAAAATSVKA